MTAIYYDITDTKIPGVVENFHRNVDRGFAYETASHFVHFYATRTEWYGIAVNLCAAELKNESKTLEGWVKYHFGAVNIQSTDYNVGESIDGVWRPGLYFNKYTYQALNTSEAERKSNEQALRILIDKLDDIFLYIEPDSISFKTYSHKLRELLILACTEVENAFMYFIDKAKHSPLNGTTYTTKDYIKLLNVLFLNEYECIFKGHSGISPIKPFYGWDLSSPTKSLPWYNSYNKTKHSRTTNFAEANMYNVIQAVMANIILYIVRFGPFSMQTESGTFSSLVNQYFKFYLVNSDERKHYIPLVDIPTSYLSGIDLYSPHRSDHILPYNVNPLIL